MPTPNPKKGVTRLHSLDAAEISLVPEGANRRRFLIFKAKGGKMPQPQHPHHELHKLIAQTDPEVMKKVDEMLKGYSHRPTIPDEEHELHASGVTKDEGAAGGAGMDHQAHAAMKAIVRIASPFKGKIPPELMHNVLDAAGFEHGGDGETADPDHDEDIGDASHQGDGYKEGGMMAIPEMVEGEEDDILKGWDGDEEDEADEDDEMDEHHGSKNKLMKSHMHEAAKTAHNAFKEHMGKLGHEKHPEVQMHMKMKKSKDGDSVGKHKGEKVSKSASAAPNLKTVDPATRRELEAVRKSNEDLARSNKELVKKNADIESRIKAQEDQAKEKEIVAKAASFTHVALPQEEIIATLKDADKIGKESFERVCKSFTTLNEQGKTSKLFGEYGSNLPNPGSSSDNAWLKIEKAAEGHVAKSGKTMSSAEAVDTFLKTNEGQRMYAEYKSGRKDGI